MFDSHDHERIPHRFHVIAWEQVPVLFIFAFCAGHACADEHVRPTSGHVINSVTQPVSLIDGLRIDFRQLARSLLESPIEVAPEPRVSRSRHPLRQITLAGGDRFDAEFLAWGTDSATFRLLNGQVIRVPFVALASLMNPPGEVDICAESFEADSTIGSDSTLVTLIDQTQSVDGSRSLRFGPNSPEYRHAFPKPLTSARMEFCFRSVVTDVSSACGEWELEWGDGDASRARAIVRIGSDRRIGLVDAPARMNVMSQSVGIDDRWHTFLALVTPEQTQLIVDDAILASFPTPPLQFRAVRFPARDRNSANILWVDTLQVRNLRQGHGESRFRTTAADEDSIILASQDELFGRLHAVNRAGVLVDVFGDQQRLPWNQLSGMTWKQSKLAVRQTTTPLAGVVAEIEMQSFVDRRDLPPGRWTVTITSSDSKMIVAQHPLVGELTIPWSDVRRVNSLFFGQLLLLDARTFHLGDSIRPDFRRHLPDGTELEVKFHLHDIPRGRPYLSFDVSELEAAGPAAPLASPFLAELRLGRLITEASLNDHRMGSVNSLIRFKATAQHPDQVRLPISRGTLSVGENSFRLRQLPLKYPGREFDDCEVGNFRLEFDLTDDP